VKREEMSIYEVLELLRVHIPKWIDVLPDDVIWHIYYHFTSSSNGIIDLLESRLQWMAFVGRKQYQKFANCDPRLSKVSYARGLLPILLLSVNSASKHHDMTKDFTMVIKDCHENFIKMFVERDMNLHRYMKNMILESDIILDTMSEFRISFHRNILAYRLGRHAPVPFERYINETIFLKDDKAETKEIVIRYTNETSFWYLDISRNPPDV
jgi:hypothetical protein